MNKITYLNVIVGMTAKAIIKNKTAPYVGIPNLNNMKDQT